MRNAKLHRYLGAVGVLMFLIALGMLMVLAKPAAEEFFEQAAVAVSHEIKFTAYRPLQ